mmetsp:Transcript_26462/g.62169  ORF Transcript_26462/g.62169 Transcript_26462/m.62169 type:complete len:825 (-) Transcript_26462:293-2767(-)
MAGTMTVSAQRQEVSTSWNDDPQSAMDSNPNSAATGLELGMAGMNLLSSTNNISNNSSIQSRSPIPTSGDSVQSIHSSGTAASNPTEIFANAGNMSRPPGLAGLSVPPIGKLGHAKSSSTSSTAHTATLTPTSSVDGGPSSELYGGIGPRGQSSPASSDHLPGIGNLGSFDTDDSAHDGLMGLQALRERSHSSPSPSSGSGNGTNSGYAASPREFSANARGFVPQSQQQARPRLMSKDHSRSVSGSSRPPLAGGSSHTVDGMGFQSTGNRSRDASPPPNAGVISRPDTQFSVYGGVGNVNDSFDSSLRRALSNETTSGDYSSYVAHRQSGQGNDHISSTFGQASLNSQQRGLEGQIHGLHGQGGLYPTHHNSQSQPGLRSLSGADYYHEANYEAGFIPHRANAGIESDYSTQQHQDMGYHTHGHQQQYQPHRPQRRSLSMQHSAYNDSDAGHGMYGMQHRRGSLGMQDRQMQRRSSDFGVGSGIGSNTFYERERAGNTGYHGQERLVSSAHSPMHSSYGSHNRHPSDLSGISTASPSMSLGSAPLYGRHRLPHSDEDLSRPLVGENIEVPGEDQYYNESMPPPGAYQRTSSMGHGPSYGANSHHLPTAGATMQAPKIVYNVKFKRTQRTFEIGPRLNRDLKVGTYVKVEADRGEDLGIVIGKAKNAISRSTSFGSGVGEMPTAGAGGGGDLKKIIRLATHDEVGLLVLKREEEDELLKVCRLKVRQRGMPMHVVDAEYQFDRHKLTFFFEADTRIDFRELVRDLFSIYKTRIWMQQLDKNTSATCPAAPAPAPLVMDYGTPIIAPVSEYEGYAQASGATEDGTE